jgi:cellulose biosynthesis protein BcsQ
MALPANLESFVLWNNKGGVGKTTLSFNIVCEYARQFEDTEVIAVDLCPQTHLSYCLLGSVDAIHEQMRYEADVKQPCTVGHYLTESLSDSFPHTAPYCSVIDPFLLTPNHHNVHIPDNVRLVCGTRDLDTLTAFIETEADKQSSTSSGARASNFWKWTMQHWRSAFEDYATRNPTKKIVVIFDTNPAFTVYTRMALAGAQHLIIPYMNDEFSVDGIKRLTSLLDGHISGDAHPIIPFAAKAAANQVQLAQIKLVVLNRYSPAKNHFVDQQVAQAVHLLFNIYTDSTKVNHSELFATPASNHKCNDEAKFKDEYFIALHDIAQVGRISGTKCIPVTTMNQKAYSVQGPGGKNGEVKVGADMVMKAGLRISDVVLRLVGVPETCRVQGFIGSTTAKNSVPFDCLEAPVGEGDGTLKEWKRKRLPLEDSAPRKAFRTTAEGSSGEHTPGSARKIPGQKTRRKADSSEEEEYIPSGDDEEEDEGSDEEESDEEESDDDG